MLRWIQKIAFAPGRNFIFALGMLFCLSGCKNLKLQNVEYSALPAELQGRRFNQYAGDYYYAASADDVKDIGAIIQDAVEKVESRDNLNRTPGLIVVVQYGEEYPINRDKLLKLLEQLSDDQERSGQRKAAESILQKADSICLQTGMILEDAFKMGPLPLDKQNAQMLLSLPESTNDLYGWCIIIPDHRCVKKSIHAIFKRDLETRDAGFLERSIASGMLASMNLKLVRANRERIESMVVERLMNTASHLPADEKEK